MTVFSILAVKGKIPNFAAIELDKSSPYYKKWLFDPWAYQDTRKNVHVWQCYYDNPARNEKGDLVLGKKYSGYLDLLRFQLSEVYLMYGWPDYFKDFALECYDEIDVVVELLISNKKLPTIINKPDIKIRADTLYKIALHASSMLMFALEGDKREKLPESKMYKHLYSDELLDCYCIAGDFSHEKAFIYINDKDYKNAYLTEHSVKFFANLHDKAERVYLLYSIRPGKLHCGLEAEFVENASKLIKSNLPKVTLFNQEQAQIKLNQLYQLVL